LTRADHAEIQRRTLIIWLSLAVVAVATAAERLHFRAAAAVLAAI
jgi:hypothetical protein